MKRYLCALLAMVIAATLCACSFLKDPTANNGGDTTGDRNDDLRAIVKLADGTIITGCVDYYKRWSEGCFQIKIDGVMYTVHTMNVTLISED